ncbi:2-C-methyl-D-erythritol 4-phosphate cytidylyltransferase [Thermocrinis ruber]|jgi:2-C-methyl-D-erythritol 4-phosphate cytidylyltransferase|uniref:2-C-methyl-D-erythritol 4-phosphate cytidylyltransferase n=1 Tax=Thermocrinis ruber TaxID=75906 RepID=W0DFG3_9AQUI|nr:2-C-methyl-D-erythritol 4-phosphate cytidylyltransferase [Thermocrinis ruber]AHE95763.1 2-C-methyl-D-erythritol 4-phosphate cytidylyltransferase [Thermocrinis ruber]
MKRSVILLAGGEGSRFGTKKQYILLGGKPLYMHSLEKVLDLFEEVILVLPEEDLQKIKVPPKVKKVAGGKERQDSVLEGILEAEGDIVIIHDCARPFASRELFLKVSELGDFEGKICALPVRDTLKQVSEGMVIKTIDRTGLWHSQTPQAFLRKVLLECHFRARSEGFFATDDAMLLERYGYRVGVVMGEPTNIKITYPEDLALAQRLL